MAKKLSDKYFVKKTENATWEDVTEKFDGVHVLTVDGFDDQGESVNIYNEQWVTAQREDFLVAGDSVVRKNVDLKLTFICGTRYGASDTQDAHDTFIDYMCNQGDIYIKSEYFGKMAHVICLKGYTPTSVRLHRGTGNSYIIGTIELHTLDKPA